MATSNSVITLRRHDLDNLRTSLANLVVFHHTAIAYRGAGQGWRSRLVPFMANTSSIPLVLFNAYNQTFFMGLFFWLSGHFSGQSLARHDRTGLSRCRFVKDKAKRLALPAVVYTLTIIPVQKVVLLPEWTADAIEECLLNHFRSVRGIQGVAWYLATLFVFDVLAAATLPRRNAESENNSATQARKKDSLASFLIRTKYPVGDTVRPLGLQLAYVSQYTFAYAMGHLSVLKSQQWLSGPFTGGCDTKQGTKSRVGFISASVLCTASLMLCLLPPFLQARPDWVTRAMRETVGGWNISAIAYAIWNEISFSIIGPALMMRFYKWHNKATDSNFWKPRYSYAVYLIHGLVIVSVDVAVDAMLVGSGTAPDWLNSSLWETVGPVVLTTVLRCVNSVVSFTVAKTLVDNVSWLRGFI